MAKLSVSDLRYLIRPPRLADALFVSKSKKGWVRGPSSCKVVIGSKAFAKGIESIAVVRREEVNNVAVETDCVAK